MSACLRKRPNCSAALKRRGGPGTDLSDGTDAAGGPVLFPKDPKNASGPGNRMPPKALKRSKSAGYFENASGVGFSEIKISTAIECWIARARESLE